MDDRRPDDSGLDDLGPPLTQLRELCERPPDADPGFFARIRRCIHRRLIAADTTDFALSAFFAACFNYLDLVLRSLLTGFRPPDRPPTRKPADHG